MTPYVPIPKLMDIKRIPEKRDVMNRKGRERLMIPNPTKIIATLSKKIIRIICGSIEGLKRDKNRRRIPKPITDNADTWEKYLRVLPATVPFYRLSLLTHLYLKWDMKASYVCGKLAKKLQRK